MRKSKFEDEKNRLDLVREKLVEAIKDAESSEHSCVVNREYERALIYQGFAKMLREIKIVCGEEKPKEIAELKARLSYIQNSSGEMFIPPEGESLD